MKRTKQTTDDISLDADDDQLHSLSNCQKSINHCIDKIRPHLMEQKDPLYLCIIGLLSKFLKYQKSLSYPFEDLSAGGISNTTLSEIRKSQLDLLAEWSEVLYEWMQHERKHHISSKLLNLMAEVLRIVIEELIQPKISNLQLINLSWAEVEYYSNRYDSHFVKTLGNLIQTKKICFPFKKFTMGDIKEKIEYLRQRKTQLCTDQFTLPGINFKSKHFFPVTYLGEYCTFLAYLEDYFKADILTEYFTEECRLLARRNDQKQSPIEYWFSKEGSVNIIEKIISLKQDLNTFNLREALYALVKECTQFKSTLACDIIRKFSAKRVLDFSAGWGDRLIAAIACQTNLYIGVDPNRDLKPGHTAAIETLALPGTKENFQIIYEPFQTCKLPDYTYDLIFTSPPFFNFEIYTESEGQSIKDYPQFNDWLVHFLFVSLKKAWEKLEVSGHMAIHITDTGGAKVCEPMNHFVQSKLEGAVYEGVIASRSKDVSDRPRPIWVWQKKDILTETEKQRVEDSAGYLRTYGEIHNLMEKMF